jgi:hypothetical protein
MDTEKEQLEKLLASRVPEVTRDETVSQEMLDGFTRLRSVPYHIKDFEESNSSEDRSCV